MKQLRLATIGEYDGYQEQSLLPLLIARLGYRIVWVKPAECDLLIIGKHINLVKWLLKQGSLRSFPDFRTWLPETFVSNRQYQPVTLFHTCENLRHDSVETDYAITFDIAPDRQSHFRFPYWMEMIDWSHEGITGNRNIRFGRLYSIERMQQPLGTTFLSKPRKAALFASHLDGPRKQFYLALGKAVQVDGFGRYFDTSIRSHSKSGFFKYDILRSYAFNLCPENKLQPGYYTEKIPEAFLADTLPISWSDHHISIDFNPEAFVNLAGIDWQNPDALRNIFENELILRAYAAEPLLLQRPSIEPLLRFVGTILEHTR